MICIFVFGSNRQGLHDKGVALYARLHHGAINGQARGLQGSSYAIVTKELRKDMPAVTLDEVKNEVNVFIDFAEKHPEYKFIITRIWCGFAGFSDEQIAPLFKLAPSNCELPSGW